MTIKPNIEALKCFTLHQFISQKMVDSKPAKLSFENTSIAFAHKDDKELNFSYLVFKLMNNPGLVKVSTQAALFALKLNLPISGITKATIFKQFCGGETIAESQAVIDLLKSKNVGAILDYSAEGEHTEKGFDFCKTNILETIKKAAQTDNIPVACMKMTGIARFGLLEKINAAVKLSDKETEEFARVKARLEEICSTAATMNVPIYIDAEESWIQDAIDRMAEEMMLKFNTTKAIVFTTLQMYRWDRLEYLKKLHQMAIDKGIVLGIKFVRGAYMEKENERAWQKMYKTPIQPSKQATDDDYNAALKFSVEHIDKIEICAGTHNEKSSLYLTELMAEKGLAPNFKGIYFSQLFGMSDHISFNLAASGYNVSKYLPYGPVKTAIPYLIRRAQENTSIAGQMGKELSLILRERDRRRLTK